MKRFPATLRLVTMLAGVVPYCALTAEPAAPAPHVANGELGVLDAKIGDDRLVISDMVYRLESDTMIVSRYGQALTLPDIPVGELVRIKADYTNAHHGFLLRRIEKVR